MTLRLRLGLTLVLAALPLLAGAAWLRRVIETRGFEVAMREFAFATMEAGGRERCEREPSTFVVDGLAPRPPAPPRRPGDPRADLPPRGPDVHPDPEGRPGPGGRPFPEGDRPPRPAPAPGSAGTRLHAYRRDFTSANLRAPRLPEELVRELRDGATQASTSWEEGGRPGRRLLLVTPWADGPAALLLVDRLSPDGPGDDAAFAWATVALVGGLLLAVLLAAGPVVRRIRRLTEDVGRAAASRYEEAVPAHGRDEIGRLADAFNAAGADVKGRIEGLEARERTLREFVANTSHDVAIPLTVLQGHLVAVKEARDAGRPVDEAPLRGAMEESHYIACLLQNLGSVARLEAQAGALERRPVDLRGLVERVVARHRPIAAGASVALEHGIPAEPVVVEGDVTLLEQAISNVVHNAIRFHRAGGHVAIVLASHRSDGTFSLRVADDGPGIPADELPRVRERAYRGREARTRAPHGAGLGLHIADDVARRHGFRLRLAPREGGGLEVVFEGPLAATAAT